MDKELRILILEDVPADAELMKHELKKGGILFTSRLVETKVGFLGELKDFAPNIILSDYKLPNFDGMAALELTKEFAPTTPFIIVTGSMNEETAVECMKAGAADYVIKDHFIRIGPAVREALENKKVKEEKARLEEALWTSAREWRAVFDAVNDPLALMDLEGRIRRCNKGMANLLGKGFNEIIGRNCCELIHWASEPIEGCPVVRTKESQERETLLLSLKERWFNIVADPVFDENKNFVGAVHIMSDITEPKRAEEALRESEERYRTAIENSNDGVVMDKEGNQISVNQKYLEIFGYGKPEEVVGKPISIVIHPDDRDRVMEIVLKRQRGEDVPSRYEFKGIRKDGSEVYIEVSATKTTYRGKVVSLAYLRDITEHKRAEEALQESEERYRDLVEHSQDLICTHDLKGQILSVNQIATKITGYDQNDLLKMNLRDILPPEFKDNFGTYLAEIKSKGVAKGLITIQTKVGERRILEYNNTLRTEGISTPVVRAMVHDITERMRAEKALRESEERLRQLFDEAPVGYHEVDAEGRIFRVNRTELKMLGYTIEEMIRQPVWKFIVEEEASRKTVLSKLAGVVMPSKSFERTYRREDGTTFPVLVEDRVLRDKKGEIIGIRSTIQDITERKRAEEALQESQARFQELFNEAPVGYHEVDAEGRIIRVNQTELEMLGYTAEEMLGQPVSKFTIEEKTPQQPVLTDLPNIVPSTQGFERTYQRKDGTTIPVLIERRVIREANGKVKSIRSTIQDITERKRAEEEIATLQEQFRQSQKMEAVGRLAGGIAHDFNNLLTIIKGYSQLSLPEIKEGDPLKENIEEINIAAGRAADLTRQLLVFSRRQILEMKVLDLNIVLQNLDKMLRRVIGENIELVTLLANDLGRVKTDPGQVEQVVMNLAVNARDAMPNGGKLTIGTANISLDEEYARSHIDVVWGHYVMFSVSDTGVGMTPQVKERIFEPFFTTKEKGKGTGLGLSTVYGIVKQSGGNIYVYSEPGRGTTFKIYLPRVDEPLEEAEEKVLGEEILRGDETILIVEDDEEVRKLAVRILRNQGYEVLEAPQGSDALLLCEEHKNPIHLMLTDMVMPGMDGHELNNRLKLLHPEIKVLYMSGYIDNAIFHKGILDKGTDYIQKPFTVEGLAGKVREVLDNKVLDNKNLSVKSPFAKGDLGGFDQG